MAFLKNVATMSNDKTNYVPHTAPTGAAYVAWAAKNYSAALRHLKTTATGYRVAYAKGQMMKYAKILKREAKTNATRMAA